MVFMIVLDALKFKFTMDELPDMWDSVKEALEEHFSEFGESVPSSVILQTWRGVAGQFSASLASLNITWPTFNGVRFKWFGKGIDIAFTDIFPEFNIPGSENLYFRRDDGTGTKVFQKGTSFTPTEYYTSYDLLKDLAVIQLLGTICTTLDRAGLRNVVRHLMPKVMSNLKSVPTVKRNYTKLATIEDEIEEIDGELISLDTALTTVSSNVSTTASNLTTTSNNLGTIAAAGKTISSLIESIDLSIISLGASALAADDLDEITDGIEELTEKLNDIKNVLGLRLTF